MPPTTGRPWGPRRPVWGSRRRPRTGGRAWRVVLFTTRGRLPVRVCPACGALVLAPLDVHQRWHREAPTP